MKRIIFALIAIAMIFLVGCGDGDVEVDMPEAVEEPEAVEAEDGESLGEQIAEVFGGYGSSEMTCEYDVPEGHATFYFKNDKFKVEMDDQDRDLEFHYLNDGEFFYMWQPGKEGSAIKWDVEFMEEQVEQSAGMDQAQANMFKLEDADEREQVLALYNADCVGSAPNDKFSAPNLDFMDMSALMEQYAQPPQ